MILLFPICIPLAAAVLLFLLPKALRPKGGVLALAAILLDLVLAVSLFRKTVDLSLPWAGFGFDMSLRLYQFSAFILLVLAGFAVLIGLYSTVFMRKKPFENHFFAYFLLTLAFSNGVALSDNFVLLLFFWEALLVTLFGMIAIGGKDAFRTATKAFIIVGITDVCMMAGIALTGHLAGTLRISQISLPVSGLGSVAFILLMIGAISKAGSMPFHSWIPDAANDAPLPFMALVPAAFEKLLGIYLLARISLDVFQLSAHSWVSTVMMTVGCLTIVLAVAMALVQKDYKRLLSYHAISQVGYMVLGIGTAVPVGIVGGLFHMINNALYKSCLFLTGGAVEKQTGTTNLEELGGLGSVMPVTFICFFVTAASISGVPPFNGFFSKELVYDGALERGFIYYFAAILGSFLTAASFLKLGHSAFRGKLADKFRSVREVPSAMLFPMITIALLCILFGLFNFIPLQHLIQPILGEARLEGKDFSGFPANWKLVAATVIVLALALVSHRFGVKSKGSAVKSADHIRYAPVLSGIYDRALKGHFDPYRIGLEIAGFVARIAYWCDRSIDWFYDTMTVNVTYFVTRQIRLVHTGNYSVYLGWSLLGLGLVVIFLMTRGVR